MRYISKDTQQAVKTPEDAKRKGLRWRKAAKHKAHAVRAPKAISPEERLLGLSALDTDALATFAGLDMGQFAAAAAKAAPKRGKARTL